MEKLGWFLVSHPEYMFARGYSVGFGHSNALLRQPTDDQHLILFRRAAVLDMQPDFWLRCAGQGYCGGTIPEFLSWRRMAQDERGALLDHRALWKNVVPPSSRASNTSPEVASNQLAKPKAKRRLMMLAPHFEMGGADKFNLDLIAALQRDHGYEVSIVTTRSSAHRWREHFERLTPDVFTLHTFLRLPDYLRFLLYLIESRQPDTVLITNCRTAYELLPFLRTHSIPSFVDYLHIEDGERDGFPQLSLKYAAFLDCTIVSSEHLKRRLIAAGKNTERMFVSTTNIDSSLWDKSRYDSSLLRTKYGVQEGVPVIAFVARLCRQKQPDVMAAALKTIRNRGLDFVCLVAGDGEDRPWLENFIREHDFYQMKLLGALQSDEVREILAISDILFLPSENEGIALTLFEAMSMGVPPVSANVGGQSELVSADCGILITPGPSQVEAYADALQTLLIDPKLRASMGARSRERICHHFTVEEMGNRMAQLFECAAGTSGFDPGAVPKNQANMDHTLNTLGSPSRLQGFVATALWLLSPRNWSAKLRNLSLLARIFLDRRKRLRLADTFDAEYYLSYQSDVRARGVPPLLHYALEGYLEDRLPSPRFDATGGEPHNREIAVNPMLRSIIHEDPGAV
ncbi:MAG: glycosyltransferase family 4 protein [Bryobacteraceae bacterium]